MLGQCWRIFWEVLIFTLFLVIFTLISVMSSLKPEHLHGACVRYFRSVSLCKIKDLSKLLDTFDMRLMSKSNQGSWGMVRPVFFPSKEDRAACLEGP